MSRSLSTSLLYATTTTAHRSDIIRRKSENAMWGEIGKKLALFFTLYFRNQHKITQNISNSYIKKLIIKCFPVNSETVWNELTNKKIQNFNFNFVSILRLTKQFSVTKITQFHDKHVSVLDLSASRLGLQFLCLTILFYNSSLVIAINAGNKIYCLSVTDLHLQR